MKFRVSNLLSFFIGAVIFGFIGFASAEILYNAKDITFKSSYTDASNVNDAVNELYIQNQILKTGDAESDDLLTGKSAVVNGQSIYGSMVNNGTFDKTINVSETLTLNKGYYDGGTISVNSSGTIMAIGASDTCNNSGSSRLLFTGYDFVSSLISYSNGVFTVKKAGSYTLKVSIMTHLTNEANTRVWITINGSDVRAITGDYLRASTSYIATLNVGDTIAFYTAGGNTSCCNMPTASIYLN